VFWSKIWFFLVAVVAALALAAALALPRPAERQLQAAEDVRLDQAVRAVQRDLALDARNRVDLALLYSRSEIYQPLKKVRDDREGAEAIAQQLHDSAKKTLDDLFERTSKLKPQFLIGIDAWGRAVARKGGDEKDWGDDLSGFFVVRDALLGYLRDDLWLVGGKLFRVAAAPVIAQPEQGVESYVGVIVVGHELDEALARTLAQRASTRCGEGTDPATKVCDTQVAFFARGDVIANSGPTTLATDIKQEFARRTGQISSDGFLGPFTVTGEGTSYRVVAQRLPGEAGAQDAFFAVYAEMPRGAGLVGSLSRLVKEDVSFGSFPWVLLGGGFLAVVIIGLLLMWIESERPLRRLVDHALALGKGEGKSLPEDQHRGKLGSIARSVNLALDRLSKEKEKTRRDLGAVYATEVDSTEARPLPPSGPLGSPSTPFAPPPRSDFALEASIPTPGPSGGFDYSIPPPALEYEGDAVASTPGAGPVSLPSGNDRAALAIPPPAPRQVRTPTASDLPPLPDSSSGSGVRRAPLAPVGQPLTPARVAPVGATRQAIAPQPALDDDILGPGAATEQVPPVRAASAGITLAATLEPLGTDLASVVAQQSSPEGEEAYFRQVYEDFIELKQKCGEPTDSLTYEKFAVKLISNRDSLRAKYACKAVRFQVYVKDGKAALKATPVKG
jgi:hypothetical protein